jgi:glycosyltransferase involved in cell wall biosynthesis
MPNGIPTFSSLIRRDYQEKINDFELIFVGRLAKVKRIDTIIKAFALVLLEDENFTLNIVGDGKEKQSLIELSRSLSIPENKIVFHGLQEDVTKFLLAADIFLLSSQNEGLPLAILEAMAAGLPVIATPVGEIPQIINSSSGLIFPVGDIQKLKEEILFLKENPQTCEKMCVKNQEIIHEFFSIQSWWKKTCTEYSKILEVKK